MIIYSATKKEFTEDMLNNIVIEKLIKSLKNKRVSGTSDSHVRAYKNSLQFMDKVLYDSEIPDDTGVAIEYVIPSSNKRVDFIISGKNDKSGSSLVIIELKQWETAKLTHKDAIVTTWMNGMMQEKEHPSYQAWSYAALLEDYNESVRDNGIALKPCAYLHNYKPDNVITDEFYSKHIEKAPVFLKNDAHKLRDFIKQFIKYGDSSDTLYLIENGRIRPSKNLADSLLSMLKGNQEFLMIDDQKIVYENALDLVNKKPKQVLIVEGGPGTGKSVIAVNLLVTLINKRLNARYVTKNAAPRSVYESKLTSSFTKSRISNLFCGSGAFTKCDRDIFDMLIVDEAHRLNKKSGMFQNQGENQIKEIIYSAKSAVFFIDEDQRVTFKDNGSKEEIKKWAKEYKAEIQYLSLSSQFRCNGSNGYLDWLDNTLQKRETANVYLNDNEYDFKVVDSPIELRDIIFKKNKINNKARIVAGYCWNWISKKNTDLYDIEFSKHKFSMKWNLSSDGSLWIVMPESVKEVGCIHTCQGLDLDYVGVIVGKDLIVRNGKVMTCPEQRAKTDASLNSYCIFKLESGGTRNGQVVLVVSNLISDPEDGQRYTVKWYSSDKENLKDGTWFHKRITLKPENNDFKDIVLENVIPGDFGIVATFVKVLE
ncbi:MAG: DUF2075 domain-containing protein [Candidatus Firestonebacteria bacterium]